MSRDRQGTAGALWLPCVWSASPQQTVLTVHAVPGAKRTDIVGLHGEALKIRVAAAPVEGQANAALIKYLAQCLSLPRRSIHLSRGASGQRKQFLIEASPEVVVAALRQQWPSVG